MTSEEVKRDVLRHLSSWLGASVGGSSVSNSEELRNRGVIGWLKLGVVLGVDLE